MKTLLCLILLLVSVNTFAQGISCLNKLLPFNRFSGVHQVVKEEWTDVNEKMTGDSAKKALKFLTDQKLFCKENEISIKVEPVCTLTIADLPQSNTCFLFTNLGYFIISRDAAKNMNFIFSRDKRFSEAFDF